MTNQLIHSPNTSHFNSLARGEWWLIDGQAIYADGDTGEYNHAGIVLDHLWSEISEAIKYDSIFSRLSIDDIGDTCMSREIINNFADELNKNGTITDEQSYDIYKFMSEKCDIDIEIINTYFNGDNSDMLDWGFSNGWVRVAGVNIECKYIDKSVLTMIASGLYDAYEYADKMIFNLECNGKWYQNIPFSVFEDGDTKALLEYR